MFTMKLHKKCLRKRAFVNPPSLPSLIGTGGLCNFGRDWKKNKKLDSIALAAAQYYS